MRLRLSKAADLGRALFLREDLELEIAGKIPDLKSTHVQLENQYLTPIPSTPIINQLSSHHR